MRIPLSKIVRPSAEKKEFQRDWDRQRETAKAITTQFDNGFDTILLADEVGMGKTYVALNVMAEHIMQSKKNDRKVLLITPPSSVLRDKWEQEIYSFDQKYMEHAENRKQLRPLQVDGYWTLLRNLHDFADHVDLKRVHDDARLCFLYFFNEWDNQRKRNSRRTLWPELRSFESDSIAFYRFCSQFSEHAIYAFLNELNGSENLDIERIVAAIENETCPRWEISNLFKRFACQQDRFEANIFIMGMSALKKPYSNSEQYKQLCMFLLGRLWNGLHYPTREAMAKSLVAAGVLPQKRVHVWAAYVQQVEELGAVDLYGLIAAADAVMATSQHGNAWDGMATKLRAGNSEGADAFFENLCAALLVEKLRLANVGLAVIDEVHNWKNGKLGARHFEKQYAPGIDNKLILSATPFQIEEEEIKRLFGFVANPEGNAVAAIESIFKPQGGVDFCMKTSLAFSEAWEQISAAPEEIRLLGELLENQELEGLSALLDQIVSDPGCNDVLRRFFVAARDYRTAIVALQLKLRTIVVRHTKGRKKRNFHIGADFNTPDTASSRTSLYLGKGYAGETDALINFVGMRLDQLIRRQSKNSYQENGRLLAGITSSRSAFRESRQKFQEKGGMSSAVKEYSALFESLLEASAHPKVAATTDRAFANFVDGRKTLIFCERVATLDEIQDALRLRINGFLDTKSSQGALKRDTILKNTAFVDNAWWLSLLTANGQAANWAPSTDRDFAEAHAFAKSCIVKAGMKASPRRTIRLIDLHMLATSHAEQAMERCGWTSLAGIFKSLFDTISGAIDADSNGALMSLLNGENGDGSERIEETIDEDTEDDIDDTIKRVYEGRRNLWLTESDKEFHCLLWQLIDSEARQLLGADGNPTQKGPALANIMSDLFEGLRKIVLRDDLIARYDFFSKLDDRTERIKDGFFSMPVGHETMSGRVIRFLEALLQESGSINLALRQNSKRQSLWQGVFLQKVDCVETLSGKVTDPNRRRRLCAAFNSPLMPDVLICTAIGSEGIDLHRHCAEIIHHDLPWNPARLEQRNGRLDRVNSLAENTPDIRIEIGIPFLANNYEEFQYRVVYSRAQKFEILMGSPSYSTGVDEEAFSDGIETIIEEQGDQPSAQQEEILAIIPDILVRYLRMDLSVVSV
ncbi:helicase-related protein [Herbaspirillum rhizosphaerae]|uniref:Helicase-related protein n=1 Tax=Herbaspirillum rhizosphaerae TaxID=346179 RepID=A0ABW8Z260_9BURK